MKKTLAILGSTGSIGTSALKVVDEFCENFTVKAISCNSNIELFRCQIEKYSPVMAVITDVSFEDDEFLAKIRNDFPATAVMCGKKYLDDIVAEEYDILLSAIVGFAGLEPTIKAIPKVKRIALANKETLVAGGELFMAEIRKYGTELVPVDSEHSAIFSLMYKEPEENVEKIIITASGGSLRDYPIDKLDSVTPETALNHPNWRMGSKITIDSATLINKGLEVIEAHFLFKMPYDRINVVIHPESIIHSMIETKDGSVYAHMGVTDMVFPILNSFFYPEKRQNTFGKLDLAGIGSLSFRKYDAEKFPGLTLCYAAGREGRSMPAVLNAANEIAVDAFLKNRIRYTDIVKVIEKTMDLHETIDVDSIRTINEIDAKSRLTASAILKELK